MVNRKLSSVQGLELMFVLNEILVEWRGLVGLSIAIKKRLGPESSEQPQSGQKPNNVMRITMSKQCVE